MTRWGYSMMVVVLLTIVVGRRDVVGVRQSKLILLMVDGLAKWMLDDPRLSSEDLRGFESLRINGAIAKKVQPEFPTMSLPNHHTLVTGLHVENHGISADYMYDIKTRRHFRRFASSTDADLDWWNETEPIWITARNQGVSTSLHWWRSCVVQFSASPMCDVADNDDPVTFDKFIKKINNVVEKLKNDEIHFALLDYDRIENVARRKGAQSLETLDEIRRLSDALQQLQESLTEQNLWPTTNVIVVSDHGMADVPLESNWYFIDDFVNMESVETVVNTGAFMMVYPYKGHEHQVYKDLSTTLPNAKILWREELYDRWRIKNAKRVSPIVIVSDIHYGIYCRTREKLVPNAALRASLEEILPKSLSGFDNKEEKMYSTFFARGPDFRPSYSIPLLRLVDVYQIMCHIFELDCHSNNGSWLVVSPMMVRPSTVYAHSDKHILSYHSGPVSQSSRLKPNIVGSGRFVIGIILVLRLIIRLFD